MGGDTAHLCVAPCLCVAHAKETLVDAPLHDARHPTEHPVNVPLECGKALCNVRGSRRGGGDLGRGR